MLPEIAKEWIDKAEEDYGFACAGIECTNYFPQICFHFQQAEEKYLKAFIVANGLEFRAVHNLLELLEIFANRTIQALKGSGRPVASSTPFILILAILSTGLLTMIKIPLLRQRK